MTSTREWPRVSGKLASLRSRIRGGLTNCEVEIFPAAQFLTLRLVISVATEDICVDLDGPGHAPPYLCVRHKFMNTKYEHYCHVIETKGWISRGVLDQAFINDVMNEFGDKGFELVSVIPISDGSVGTARIALFFKRCKLD